MKNLMRTIFIFCFLQTSLYAGSWIDGQVTSNEVPSFKAILFTSLGGELKVGLLLPSDECTSYEENVMKAPAMEFNGTLVKMYAQCLGNNSRMDFPRSIAGMSYLINEFKRKEIVLVQQDGFTFTFSAKGFNSEYNSEMKKALAEQNAL